MVSTLEEVDIEKELKKNPEESIVLSEPDDYDEDEYEDDDNSLVDNENEDNLENSDGDSGESKTNVPISLSIKTDAFKEELDEIATDDTDSDDEDYNENMNKLEQDINKDILFSYHPETKQINFKELLTLSNITRNKKGEIVDNLHTTLPFLTRYEKAKILGLRAKQLNHGSKPFVEISRDIIDGHTIAHMELVQNKIPFIIRRPLPNGGSEYWKVSDLKDLD